MDFFTYKNSRYYEGTIVEMNKYKEFKFNSKAFLKFVKIDEKNPNLYVFCRLNDCWKTYKIKENQLELYIKEITHPYIPNINICQRKKLKDIDGIEVALIWFIIGSFGSLFFKGIINQLLGIAASSFFFFYWCEKRQ